MLATYAVVSEVLFDECGLSEEQARSVVLEGLARRDLDAQNLTGPEDQRGSCTYSYYFEGQGQKLNYVVTSTWLHGVKVTMWDYKREERQRALTNH